MVIVKYRNPKEEDIGSIVNIINSSRKDLPSYESTSERDVMRTFNNKDLSQSRYWLALVDEKAVGYGNSIISSSHIDSGLSEGLVGVDVLPEYREKCIEKRLIGLSLDHLRSNDIKIAQCIVDGSSDWYKKILSEFGFEDVNRGYVMLWDGKNEPKAFDLPIGINLESHLLKKMGREDLERAVKIRNEIFSNGSGNQPITLDVLMNEIFASSDATRTTFVRSGESTVGICTFEESSRHGAKSGIVETFGVSKPYQGKGIGRALLSDGMRWLWNRGIKTIYLDVDAKNTKAVDFYTSNGFKISSEFIFYQLEL